MSLRTRHWKQHWDPNAPMVYRKRLLVLGEQLEAGAPVTEEHIRKIGIGRIKRWWQADILAHGEHPTKMAAAEPELRVNSAALREGLESELRKPEPDTSPDAERLRAELESELPESPNDDSPEQPESAPEEALAEAPQAELEAAPEEPQPEDAQPEG